MAYLTHILALFAGVAMGFLICCLFASRTRSRNLDEIDDDEQRYYDQTPHKTP